MIKTCIYCNNSFTPTSYQVKRNRNQCNKCHAENQKAWRKKRAEAGNPVKFPNKPIEKRRAYDAEYMQREDVKKRKREYIYAYFATPEGKIKNNTRRATRRAIKSGKLIKEPCEVCGTEERVQAHHDDYSKPLDVKWLCALHHAELHKKLKAAYEAKR